MLRLEQQGWESGLLQQHLGPSRWAITLNYAVDGVPQLHRFHHTISSSIDFIAPIYHLIRLSIFSGDSTIIIFRPQESLFPSPYSRQPVQ